MGITSLFVFLLANYFIHVVRPKTFTVKNNCDFIIWPGVLTTKGIADTTGFQVDNKSSASFTTSTPWAGRMWARYDCSAETGKVVCNSCDCGSGKIPCNGAGPSPPCSFAEWTTTPMDINQGDDYDVSLVEGFNLPLKVTPIKCKGVASTAYCTKDINKECPEDLVYKDEKGKILGCKSACVAFDKPEYCCTGDYKDPDTCKPTKYSQFFKDSCPQAYSYAGDDTSLTFPCIDGAKKYEITFCPDNDY